MTTCSVMSDLFEFYLDQVEENIPGVFPPPSLKETELEEP